MSQRELELHKETARKLVRWSEKPYYVMTDATRSELLGRLEYLRKKLTWAERLEADAHLRALQECNTYDKRRASERPESPARLHVVGKPAECMLLN